MSISPLAPSHFPASTGDALVPGGWDSDPSLVSQDLSGMSTRELRVLSNQLYRSLEADFPPYGTREDYVMVTEELEQREARARQ